MPTTSAIRAQLPLVSLDLSDHADALRERISVTALGDHLLELLCHGGLHYHVADSLEEAPLHLRFFCFLLLLTHDWSHNIILLLRFYTHFSIAYLLLLTLKL